MTGTAMISVSQPFTHELPRIIYGIIAAEPDGKVASTYRLWVRTVMMPLIRQVSALLIAHSAVIEWPTIEWLSEKVSTIVFQSQQLRAFAATVLHLFLSHLLIPALPWAVPWPPVVSQSQQLLSTSVGCVHSLLRTRCGGVGGRRSQPGPASGWSAVGGPVRMHCVVKAARRGESPASPAFRLLLHIFWMKWNPSVLYAVLTVSYFR